MRHAHNVVVAALVHRHPGAAVLGPELPELVERRVAVDRHHIAEWSHALLGWQLVQAHGVLQQETLTLLNGSRASRALNHERQFPLGDLGRGVGLHPKDVDQQSVRHPAQSL